MIKPIEADVLLKFHEDNERMINSDENKRIEKKCSQFGEKMP